MQRDASVQKLITIGPSKSLFFSPVRETNNHATTHRPSPKFTKTKKIVLLVLSAIINKSIERKRYRRHPVSSSSFPILITAPPSQTSAHNASPTNYSQSYPHISTNSLSAKHTHQLSVQAFCLSILKNSPASRFRGLLGSGCVNKTATARQADCSVHAGDHAVFSKSRQISPVFSTSEGRQAGHGRRKSVPRRFSPASKRTHLPMNVRMTHFGDKLHYGRLRRVIRRHIDRDHKLASYFPEHSQCQPGPSLSSFHVQHSTVGVSPA